MSARTAALRAASASVVAAAIAAAVLMPTTASADETNPQALKTTMSAAAPSGPLTRGGATESFELTVTNATDKPSAYHPWMLLDPTGTGPLQQADVVYKVDAVNAPATESKIGQQDGEWQGLFYPAGKPADGFEIPAGATMVWKVTIGLGKNYPASAGDFTLRASSYSNEVTEANAGSLTFKTSPAAATTAPAPAKSASPAPAATATAPAPTASATTPAAPVAEHTPATGSMEHTGSDSDSNTALYAGLAAALVVLGGAAAWFVRRRRTVRG
ncbi:LAETG motif-containing sortase-dependent surface protein [Streptomyces sp. ZAF1911]|uniref:LAETG motif-containing sortase-dependent surface protein n=1 Tax=Streptomyces sp. ZAF1911 TaxID=2944129 RepID=UPI00237A50D0|nr:LAETG motif-containing sortase-dependent surface protein [Streptomyces sp. ZAF1911]MDD9377158.1 LAETG motif-containing sortase-dependent surface protein [Streptomyces sp. ZAF1911]